MPLTWPRRRRRPSRDARARRCGSCAGPQPQRHAHVHAGPQEAFAALHHIPSVGPLAVMLAEALRATCVHRCGQPACNEGKTDTRAENGRPPRSCATVFIFACDATAARGAGAAAHPCPRTSKRPIAKQPRAFVKQESERGGKKRRDYGYRQTGAGCSFTHMRYFHAPLTDPPRFACEGCPCTTQCRPPTWSPSGGRTPRSPRRPG